MAAAVNITGYELLEKLGSGASGTVYKARQISMDRLVAIKILPGELAQDRRFIERFTREARAVAKLNHSNVVTGIDVGEAQGCWYFVMEYVDGESAAVRVQRDGAIPEKEALEMVHQVSLALDHAYKNGIVHRDIKPANILLTLNGIAKLADLGVAKQTEGDGSAAGGRVFGTPYYMSPEQARGGGDIDIRSDVYSLGATLYHLLTGKPPFHGHPPAVVMAKQIAEEPEDVKKLNPKVSRAAAALIACMMAKDRDDRPETPTDLDEEIRRVQKGRMPSKGAALAPAMAPGRARRHAEPSPQAGGGKGGMIAAAVVGVVILLAGGVWAVMNSDKPGTDPGPDSGSSGGADVQTTPPSAGGAERAKPGPETLAREALNFLIGRKLSPEKELPELRKIVEAHAGTAAARDATARAEKLETEIKTSAVAAEMEERIAALHRQAAPFVEKGQFGKAIEVFKKVESEGTFGAIVAKDISALHDQAEMALVKAGAAAKQLCGEGEFQKARDELGAVNVDGIDDLAEQLKGLLAGVDAAEQARAQAREAKLLTEAEAVYTALSAKVNAELASFKPDDASRLLRAARRDKRLKPVLGYIGEDEDHVGYFRDVIAAAAKGAASLRGNTRTFKMRDRTETTGKVQSADRNGVTIQRQLRGGGGGTMRMTLAFSSLSDAEIVSLAVSSLDERQPVTRLKTAVLYAVGGDIDAAKRELEAARELGADTSSVERRWIGGAEETRAAELLAEARRLYAAFQAATTGSDAQATAEARKRLAETLKELGNYSHTKTYKNNLSREPANDAPAAPKGAD